MDTMWHPTRHTAYVPIMGTHAPYVGHHRHTPYMGVYMCMKGEAMRFFIGFLCLICLALMATPVAIVVGFTLTFTLTLALTLAFSKASIQGEYDFLREGDSFESWGSFEAQLEADALVSPLAMGEYQEAMAKVKAELPMVEAVVGLLAAFDGALQRNEIVIEAMQADAHEAVAAEAAAAEAATEAKVAQAVSSLRSAMRIWGTNCDIRECGW